MSEIKTAVITGASRGIGKVLAIGFAKENYKTILIARNKEQLSSAKNEIDKIIGNKKELEAEVYSVDITDFEKVQNIINEIITAHKRIDVLVNNAGIWRDGSTDISINEYKELLDVNLVAPYAILQKVIPQMKEQGSGYIFNISSRAGTYGFPHSGSYVSSKFGLNGLSESIYRQLAEYNVKVTSINPSYVNTDMAQQVGPTIGPDEMIQPEDIMKTINWLLSLSAHVYIKEVIIECRKKIK